MHKILRVGLAALLSISLCALPVYGAKKSSLPEGFSGLEGQVSALYIYDDAQMIAYDTACWIGSPLGPNDGIKEVRDQKGEVIDWQQDISYLTALAPKPLVGELGKQLTPISSMDILLEDNTKFSYGFYENGISVAKGEPEKSVGKAVSYSVDKKAVQTLLKSVFAAAKVGVSETVAKPTWLTVMRYSRATKLTIQTPKNTHSWTPKHENFRNLFDSMLRRFDVKSGSMRAIKYTKLPKTGTIVTIDFNSKVRYTIDLKPNTITIYVNDRDYALRYDCVRDETANIEYLVNNPDVRMPVDTGKPVIYLYPTEPTDVSVKLGYKGQLNTTIPAYNGGWQVTAHADGRLINKANGKEYPYLFWDGYDDTVWDFSKGFVVAKEDTETFLEEKLTYLGLNETESKDFIEYWLPELQKNVYNQITFATEQYEALAPMLITPVPDSILRVFMTYRPLEQPVEIPPQTLTQFERNGFTVVEWGGARPNSK